MAAGTDYVVFAPPPKPEERDEPRLMTYVWYTVTSDSDDTVPDEENGGRGISDTLSNWILPPATLEAVGNRISELYKNTIFADPEDEEDVHDDDFISRFVEGKTEWNKESRQGGVLISL